MFEQVKDYKSACKVLGIKPIDKRRKLEEHVLLYIQLCTITQAINFIANGNKPLFSGVGVGNAAAGVDTHLRFISEDAAEYAAKTFKPLYMKHIFGID